MRQKVGLAEKGSSFGAKVKKEGVCPVEARSGDMGGIQRCSSHCREKIAAAEAQLELNKLHIGKHTG